MHVEVAEAYIVWGADIVGGGIWGALNWAGVPVKPTWLPKTQNQYLLHAVGELGVNILKKTDYLQWLLYMCR